jgi:gamma-glutamyl phosphate reductase
MAFYSRFRDKRQSSRAFTEMFAGKLQAEPMGLEELTNYKFVVTGDGQLRE